MEEKILENKNSGTSLPDKPKMAKISLIILGVYGIILTVFIVTILTLFGFLLFAGTRTSNGNDSMILLLFYSFFALFFCGIYLFFAILGFLTAKAIGERKKWAKIAGIILAVLSILFGHFLGMALGILILVAVLDKETEDWLIN